jgi:putative copper export protein
MMDFLSIQQNAGVSLSWAKVALELIGFLPYFAIFGALGFRLFVLRNVDKLASTDQATDVFAISERGAASVGLTGGALLLIGFAATAAWNAYTQHISPIEAIARAGPKFIAQGIFGLLFLAAFVLAARRTRGSWVGIALICIAFALRNITLWRWTALVNPFHEVAAGLWLGTLFVLVAVGLPAILRHADSRDQRGPLVAEMVARFSPLALLASAVLGLTGIITSWVHLKYLAALWTTPYGYALVAKLCVVVIVVALGAWNWRRMVPKLGSEEVTHQLQFSARTELVFAAIVLLVTAVLVSLPSPQL